MTQAPAFMTARVVDVLGILALAASLVLCVLEPLHGPVLLSLSGSHGFDLGDLVALPLALVGIALLAGGTLHTALLGWLASTFRDQVRAASVALVAFGASLILVQVFGEASVSDTVAHAGALPAALSLVTLVGVGVLFADPANSREVFGTSLTVVLAALLLGFLVDVTDAAAGSVVGPTVLAAVLAVTMGRRQPAAQWILGSLTVVLIVSDLASLVDVRTLEPERELFGGGLMRTGALGVVLVVAGTLSYHHRVRSEHARSAERT